MNDISLELRRLVEALYLRTNEGKVEWSINQSEKICETHLGDGFVQVVQDANEDGDYYSYIRILNSEKSVVDNIYGGSLGKDALPINTAQKDYWELMRDLYSSAQRSALGADRVISSMVSALKAEGMDMSDIPF